MTALLTDEQIIVACHNHAQAATRLMGDTEERQEHLEYAERDFEEGARFARSIYEARLAEDAKRLALANELHSKDLLEHKLRAQIAVLEEIWEEMPSEDFEEDEPLYRKDMVFLKIDALRKELKQ